MVKNILIMIHGMIPSVNTKSHLPDYETFWQELKNKDSRLEDLFESGFSHPDSNQEFSFIGVEWCNIIGPFIINILQNMHIAV